jgi:hypothetical protein
VQAPEEGVAQHRDVFQRFMVRGQAETVEQTQRRVGRQLGKPAVEGTHLHAAPTAQQLFVQGAQRRRQLLGIGRRQAALAQRGDTLLVRAVACRRRPSAIAPAVHAFRRLPCA